jgi:hypothetical protein
MQVIGRETILYLAHNWGNRTIISSISLLLADAVIG